MKKTLWLAIIVSTHFFCIQSAETQEIKTENKKFGHFIFHLLCPLSSQNSAALAILLQQQRTDTNHKKGSSSRKPSEPYLRKYTVKLLAPLSETVRTAVTTLCEAEQEPKPRKVLIKKMKHSKKQTHTSSNMFAGLSIE